MNLGLLYKNKTDNWCTPDHIISFYKKRGFEDFNPLCVYYSNSFLKPYKNYFCNPPFSNIEPFVDYMINCSKAGFDCVMLLPVRTCTNWFIKLLNYGCVFTFIGRIAYSNNKNLAPFDSMLVEICGFEINKFRYCRNFVDLNDSYNYVQLSIFDFEEVINNENKD